MKALVTAEVNSDIIKELENLIDITYEGWEKENRVLTEEEMISYSRDKDIIITSYDPITKKVIDQCPNLKLIVCTRSNPVNIDIKYARKRNIQISYAPGRNSDCTAEFTVALMLAVTRKIPMAYKALKDGEHVGLKEKQQAIKAGLRRDVTWDLNDKSPYVLFKGMQLKGKTVGIIGYGSIGRRVANICGAFGMNVLINDPFFKNTDEITGVTFVSFEKLLKQADVVSVHCKDCEETQNLINARAFELMKKTAFLINTSRGALVDEQALIDALAGKKIAGAALDVFSSEPIAADHPFITELDNVVITPHLAGATYDAIDNHTHQLVEDVKLFLEGKSLKYEYKL